MIGEKWHGVNIYNNTTSEWMYAKPVIYSSNQWQPVDIYVYISGNWQLIGASCTPIIPFFANQSPFKVDTNHDQLMVPQFIGRARLKDSAGNYLNDTNGNNIYIDGKGAQEVING